MPEYEISLRALRVTIFVMRRILALLAVLGLMATACGSAAQTVEVASETASTTAPVASPSEAAEDQPVAAAEVEPTPAVETTTTTAAPEPLRSGREAILANHTEGRPYVLWYWGAH